MKHLFTYLLLCISAAIILSSCGHSMSLTKRHYRNGYHFEHAGKTTTPKINNVAGTKKESETSPVKTEAINSVPTRTIETVPVINSNFNTETFTKRTSPELNTKTVVTASAAKITIGRSVIKQQVQNIKTQMKSDDDNDGLSLFWLVILVVVIIWFFG
ncbi:MAG: hypothetical protein ACXVPU_19900, partial [Bacteroidia bacterium]